MTADGGIPDVTQVRRLELRPGDRIVITLDHVPDDREWDQLKQDLREGFGPGFPVVVLPPGMDLTVLAAPMRDLAAFRVGGFDDEGMEATEPVQVICRSCGGRSPWFTYRDDGGADYTAELPVLVEWAQAHECSAPVKP